MKESDPRDSGITRYEIVGVVMVHGLLFAALVWVLAFLIPSLTAFKGLGLTPPVSFELVLGMAIIAERFLLLLIPAALALLWLDGLVYRLICVHQGKGTAAVWLVGVTVVLLGWLIFCLMGFTAPLRMAPIS